MDIELAPGYSLNTPAMHANLHTEFIHSVSRSLDTRQIILNISSNIFAT